MAVPRFPSDESLGYCQTTLRVETLVLSRAIRTFSSYTPTHIAETTSTIVPLTFRESVRTPLIRTKFCKHWQDASATRRIRIIYSLSEQQTNTVSLRRCYTPQARQPRFSQ